MIYQRIPKCSEKSFIKKILMKKLIENGRKLCALSRPLDSIFLVLRVLDTTVSLSFFLSQIRGKWMWEVP